ncbi:MAG: DHHW family protein [Eubacteriales bacterium]|nr:DHHW family protein [Eubacteriales bacterium]
MDSKNRKFNIGRISGACILAVFIIVLDILFVAFPKKTFSENENRYLQAFPVPSAESIVSGKWMDDINSYLCDHFPFRDSFMTIRTGVEKAEGRSEINGIYICSDGYFIEPYDEPKNTEKTIRIFKSFYESLPENINTELMLVPTAIWTLKDKLPAAAPYRDQQSDAMDIINGTGIPAVDCFAALSEAYENADAASSGAQTELYYKTDHHWTTYGAYIGYKAYCEKSGIDAVPLEKWNSTAVSTDFHGTIYSKLNDYTVPGDTIEAYSLGSDDISVVYEDTHEESDSLYNPEYLGQKDKYSYFLDNLHSLITVTNENAGTDRSLVLIKDSYANCMVPFLSHHFKHIYVFDTRSYKLGPSAFIAEHPEVTDVLILYNMNMIDTDLGIGGIY